VTATSNNKSVQAQNLKAGDALLVGANKYAKVLFVRKERNQFTYRVMLTHADHTHELRIYMADESLRISK
jgi:hypothetical protein